MKTANDDTINALRCPFCGVGPCFGSYEQPDGTRVYECRGQNEDGCRQRFTFHEADAWRHFVVVRNVVDEYESDKEYKSRDPDDLCRDVLVWLGRWRDELPHEAVVSLQDILGVPKEVP